jgi:DNA-binding LacI/PurR family transcriptional regulator
VTTVNPPGTSPTLDEVARAAGVSRATASRAVNGGPKVSEGARRAVEEAVRSLGYVPNRAARALVTRRTDSVAVVVPEPDDRVFNDPFFASTLRAVTRVLGEREVQLVLLLARPGAEETRMLRYLSNRHVDGALVVSHHREDRLAELLPQIGLPCVFGGRPWTGSDRVPYVDVDNVAGGREATEHLVRRGRRRIGTIAGPADMTAAMDRLAGWHDALRAAGLPADAVVHGDFTEEGGRRAAEELFDHHPHLDGLVVASDLMARSALAVARARGRRVPDDLAVVGYDDLGVAETTDPPLTTMKNPISEMAERATRLLLDRIDGRETGGPYRLIIPSQLVVRAST